MRTHSHRPKARAASLMLAALCVLTCGCVGGPDVEVLESRLRMQEDRLRETADALASAQAEATDARETIAALQSEVCQPLPGGQAPVKLAFASLLTGGIDEDGRPGDEAVRAVIQPLNENGGPVEAVGRLEVELLDVAASPDDRVRGRWSFDGEELHKQWDDGLFASGYTLELTPEDGPLPDDALLIARFQTPDGRQVEATRTVRLRPAGTDAVADFKDTAVDAVRQVSAAVESMPSEILNADFADVLPVREPPKGDAKPNPFAEFEPLRSIKTSDVWTDETLPTMR